MNTSSLLKELANSDSQSDAERAYEKFYSYAERHTEEFGVDERVEQVLAFHHNTDALFVKSYCLLFLGAIFDAAQPSSAICEKVAKTLIEVLTNLVDFRVFDEKERYVHTFSHALYLTESLLPQLRSENLKNDILGELLNTYLRADVVFKLNEDVLFATVLNEHVREDAEVDKITKSLLPNAFKESENQNAAAIIELNKRLLWTALRLVSEDNHGCFYQSTNSNKQALLLQ